MNLLGKLAPQREQHTYWGNSLSLSFSPSSRQAPATAVELISSYQQFFDISIQLNGLCEFLFKLFTLVTSICRYMYSFRFGASKMPIRLKFTARSLLPNAHHFLYLASILASLIYRLRSIETSM